MARTSLKSPVAYNSPTFTSSYYPSAMSRKYSNDSSYLRNNLHVGSTSTRYDTPSYRSTGSYLPSSSDYNAGGSRRTLRKRASSPSGGGRPLPPGPGPQDSSGRKLSIHNNFSGGGSSIKTSVHTRHATDAYTSSNYPRPVRADHSTKVGRYSPSTYRDSSFSSTGSTGSLRRRTGSVSDLSANFESTVRITSPTSGSSLPYSRKYGSNLDLSRSPISTPDKTSKDFFDTPRGSSFKGSTSSSSSTKHSSTLPDIKGSGTSYGSTRVTSRPPSGERSTRRDSSDDAVVKRTAYADSRHSSYSSANTSNSLDYNQNKSDGGLLGLRNLGNTCFMNSVIQSLSNTRSLLEYCLESSYEEEINASTSTMKGVLIKSYGKLMKTLWNPSDSFGVAVSPTDFKSQISKFAPRFIGYNQQDAQEFLVYLLEGLHEDLNRVQKKKKRFIDDSCEVETISAQDKAVKMWKHYITCDNSKIVDTFVGQLKSSLTCTVCDYKSNTFDPFWQLSLPIKKSRSSVSLLDCLDLFTQQEVLDGEEKPMCAKCKQRQKCTKRFYIQKFPKVLVIHLKRFNQGAYIRSKLSTLVEFPVADLDMRAYAADHCNSPVLYNLYATINHSGSTVGGHYTADTKHPYTGKWNHFDDTRVSSTSKTRLQSERAYVLFYELVDHSSHL